MPAQKPKAPEEPIPLPSQLPALPVPVKGFLRYVEQNPGVPVRQLMEPFLQYESVLRAYFAQEPEHEFVQGDHVNLISVFEGSNAELLKIHARNLAEESKEEQDKYIMNLRDDERKASGDRILVESFKEFKDNFNVFSEGSLMNMDWSNVVAAGSSVMTPLLKVPTKHAENKRALRNYYHEILAPASDIDLFIYGIDSPEEAIKKMAVIESTIKNNLLWETTTIRTRNTVTIVSQYPNRHVQIVLRLYKSPSQILTGFDVPSSCFAYDGTHVLANPRALAACMTQCNDIDLTRRSPSYENRLSKYSHRGFEVYCAFLNRTRIDPSIFERSFARVVGLARLLVLEALPRPEDRDSYVELRRREMGRPPRNINHYRRDTKDIKNRVDDEVAEWDFEDVSGYQKFSIPYGADYNAKRIEKLFFKKDLLLNAEWNPQNQPPNRTVRLHRHPVFFGNVEHVVEDCCGFCPQPVGEEEEKVHEEENKIYVSGRITFLADDPGRQEIGSFYPLGPEDYTEMAYVGSTEMLCAAIVDSDVAYVKSWCAQEGVDLNRRDFCGRTPLLLACMGKDTDLEVVKTLVDAGARLVARVQDGRTALHFAAAKGRVDIVKVLLEKSALNEHERDEKEEKRKEADKAAKKKEEKVEKKDEDEEMKDQEEGADGSEKGSNESYDNMSDAESTKAPTNTTHGFVKVKNEKDLEAAVINGDEEDDDIYDINVIDWDNGMSPLHHAIVNGHEDVIETLVSGFGADALLPMKLYHNDYSGRYPGDAILNLVLALKLKDDKKKASTAEALLKVGASSAQANSFHKTSALHYMVMHECMAILDKMFELDGPSALSVIDNIGNGKGDSWSINGTPLITALTKSKELATFLIEHGAKGVVPIESYIHILDKYTLNTQAADQKKFFNQNVMQPIQVALIYEYTCDIIARLIAAGADPSTVTQQTWCNVNYNGEIPTMGSTVLDFVREKIKNCRDFLGWGVAVAVVKENEFKERVVFGPEVLDPYEEGSYQRFYAELQLKVENKARRNHNKSNKPTPVDEKLIYATEKKKAAVKKLLESLIESEETLVAAGAKTYHEVFPEKHEIYLKQLEEEERQRKIREATYTPLFNLQIAEVTEVKKEDTDHIFKFVFRFNAPYLGEGKIQEGYLRLFEAIWRGTPEDANLVKKLTLGPSGEGDDKLPALNITAVNDYFGYNALWLALYRRNWDMAKLVLAIVQEQYEVQDESSKEKQYVLEVGDAYDSDASEGEYDKIQMRVVDTAFTVENIGIKRDMVKCRISPYNFLSTMMPSSSLLGKKFLKGLLKAGTLRSDDHWTPLSYAIFQNDIELFRFILKLAAETKEGGTLTYLNFDANLRRSRYGKSNHLRLALTLGRIEILEEIMKAVPFGIPFSELEEADEEFQMQKPQYYQGLTVYGTKRKDWASSSYPAYATNSENMQKPIQIAVYYGQLDSIKWLLSDRPFECLKAFIEAHPDDMKTKLLKKQGDGLGFLLQKGLGVETTLLPHLAIKGWHEKYPMETFRFLLSRPGALEVRTNLSMNLALYAVQEAGLDEKKKIVVEELRKPEYEVDFSARDNQGRNVLHHTLVAGTTAVTDFKRLKGLLELLPKDVLETAWTQRKFVTSQTPLSYWLQSQWHAGVHIPSLRLILKYSKGRELGIANSEGNLPIHWAYQMGYDGTARIITEIAPQYLHTENANGRTPVEIATSRYLSDIGANPPSPPLCQGRISYTGVVDQYISSFYPPEEKKVTLIEDSAKMEADGGEGMEIDDEKEEEPEDGVTWESDLPSVGDMYLVAIEVEKKYPGKRKLVSLADANELAKRITNRASTQTVEFDGGDILSLW